MSDNPLVAAAVVDQEPAGTTVPAPTAEQEKASDQAFANPVEHHAALELLGMVASVQFLHDLAGEMYRKNDKDEELKPEETPRLDNQEEPV